LLIVTCHALHLHAEPFTPNRPSPALARRTLVNAFKDVEDFSVDDDLDYIAKPSPVSTSAAQLDRPAGADGQPRLQEAANQDQTKAPPPLRSRPSMKKVMVCVESGQGRGTSYEWASLTWASLMARFVSSPADYNQRRSHTMTAVFRGACRAQLSISVHVHQGVSLNMMPLSRPVCDTNA
jgi:hypothetical protein